MKCAFKFPVKWSVSFDNLKAVSHEGWIYEFISENNYVTAILVTVTLKESDPLPELKPTPNKKGEFDFSVNLPSCTKSLMKSLRTLEGFLAVYGLEEILLDETLVSWVPETDEKKKRLTTTSFSFKFKGSITTDIVLPFSVISRSIAASKTALDWEVPLSFFRKGRNDFQKRRYIDAIYDFYFLLETLFGGGKTKNFQIEQEFKKSAMLLRFVAEVLNESEMGLIKRGRNKCLDFFRSKYGGKNSEDYIDALVRLRGFLHHHSQRNNHIWHPAEEFEFEVDAFLLLNICFKVCCNKVESLICTPNP